MTVIEDLRRRVLLKVENDSEVDVLGEVWREARRDIFSGTTADEADDAVEAKRRYLSGLFALAVLLVNDEDTGANLESQSRYVSLLTSTVDRLGAVFARVMSGCGGNGNDNDGERSREENTSADAVGEQQQAANNGSFLTYSSPGQAVETTEGDPELRRLKRLIARASNQKVSRHHRLSMRR
jgi:hypothetical protein